jgi:hypothetical protein
MTDIPHGTLCTPCLANAHHQRAVEYVQPDDPSKGMVAMCLWHRDGDPCPECTKLRAAAEEVAATRRKNSAPVRSGQLTSAAIVALQREVITTLCDRGCGKRRHRGKCVGQSQPKAKIIAAKNSRPTTLQTVVEAYSGRPVFTRKDAIEFRHPSQEEIAQRFKRGPKDGLMQQVLDALVASPSGYLELKVPLAFKPRSFQARIASNLRKRHKDTKYAVSCDLRERTVVIWPRGQWNPTYRQEEGHA